MKIDWLLMLGGIFQALQPSLPYLLLLFLFGAVATWPIPGRGPGFFPTRDVWRGFKFDSRRVVLERCGGRCEGAVFLAWGRCDEPATEVDHIYPWSKGGPTTAGNGQGLCAGHNRRKSAMTPPWWYVRSLEKRRRAYFPDGVSVRVVARMTPEDKALRAAWAARRR